MGVDDEWAPIDTTVLIIHPSVTVVKRSSFCNCERIKKCFMHDGVLTIEKAAFKCCLTMEVIRLSQSLTTIGERAFKGCSSLEAIFLPPSVNQIGEEALMDCKNLRIFPLPLNFHISQIGNRMLRDCGIFFKTTQIQEYDDNVDNNDDNHVHQQIINFYRDQVTPVHKACLHTHVTCQTIQLCVDTHGWAIASITDHDGMTPLHILAMNPHADISAILACFDLDMSSAQYSVGLFEGASRAMSTSVNPTAINKE